MNRAISSLLTCLWFASTTAALAQGTSFTYQGRLLDSGAPANGLYDLRMRVFGDPLGNTLLTTNIFFSDLAVSNGLFTVSLDFGAGVFDGSGRWLEIGVRPGASTGAYSTLSPLQPLNATPYSLHSINASSAASLTGPVPDALLSANIARLDSSPAFTGPVTAPSFIGSGAQLTGISSLDSASGGPPREVTVDPLGHVGVGTNNTGAALQIAGGSLYTNTADPKLAYALVNNSRGITNMTSPVNVFVVGTRAYVTSYNGALEILDVSNPFLPVLLGEVLDATIKPGSPFTHMQGASGLFVTNNIAYVTAETPNTLNIIDVSNPANPVKLAELTDGVGGITGFQIPTWVLVSGNRAFVAGFLSSCITVLDVSTPSSPVVLKQIFDVTTQPGSTFTNLVWPYEMALVGTNLFVAARGASALNILDVSDPTNPKLQSVIVDASVNPASPYTHLKSANWVEVVNNTAYIASGAFTGGGGGASLTILDVTDPKNPVKLSEAVDASVVPGSPFTTLKGAWAVRVDDKTAYVTSFGGNAVTAVDVSSPGAPRLLKTFVNGVNGINTLNFPEGLGISGSTLYVVGDGSAALNVFDLRSQLGLEVDGFVGIGTAAPRAALDVAGNIMSTGSVIADGMFSGNGAGLTNLNAWALLGNASTVPGVQFLGTLDNRPLDFRVNNKRALQLAPTTNTVDVIGGDVNNFVAPGVYGATIGGGGTLGYPGGSGLTNKILANFATIGGGVGNTSSGNFGGANGDSATVGGGWVNSAVGNNATVAGGAQNTARGDNSAVAGGFDNFVATGYGAIGGGYSNIIQGFSQGSVIGGGFQNLISSNSTRVTISGGEGSLVNSNSAYTTIGGGQNHTVGTNAAYATIGGGFANAIAGGNGSGTIAGGSGNSVVSSASFGTIGGGQTNLASGKHATVAGGGWNTASGASAFVGGGGGNTFGGPWSNTASGNWSSVVGGWLNTASGYSSLVAGGGVNTASGIYGIIPGGYGNTAAGYGSFAAGIEAQAIHDGSFVWGDDNFTQFSSTAPNQFNIRSANGVRIQSDVGIHLDASDRPLIVRDWDPFSPAAPFYKAGIGRWGLYMEPARLTIGIPGNDVAFKYFQVAKYNLDGSYVPLVLVDQGGNVTATSFNPTSDRNAKEKFTAVDSRSVLEKVLSLPISGWSYKADPATSHIGPMAQDFYSAFGVGLDDKHIATVDADGVALAAIQGLNQKVEDQASRLKEKDSQILELEQRLRRLEKLVSKASGDF